MLSKSSIWRFCALALFFPSSLTASIAEINGNKFISPYSGKTVTNVTGLITAQGPDGFWIRSTQPDQSSKTSESIYIYGNASASISTGDVVSLSGTVSEYRSSSEYLYLTEINKPSDVKIISQSNKYSPLILGSKSTLSPPTEQFTSLDKGNVFGLPSNTSRVSQSNPTLQPSKYGLDFWQSLSGELVTIKSPVAVSKANKYGDTWVIGNWNTTDRNSRGGLTVTPNDGNPEAIIIGEPLDGTKNPTDTKLGDSLQHITGVVSQAFGYYTILPLTKIEVTQSQSPTLPSPVSFKSAGDCTGISIGDYNIENYSSNLSATSRAEHIVKYLNTPDILFLQEIQDNDGPTNDGVVSANQTLETIVTAIDALTSVRYSHIDIDPVNDQDGGQPGGNIRVAYLYNPSVVTLTNPNPGSSTQAVQVLSGPNLSVNPGRIDPTNSVWKASRKPLAAQWTTVKDKTTFFTINVHFTAKLGGTSIESDARPPVNGGVDQRISQANVTGTFVAELLAQDPNASIVVGGDFNEFTLNAPVQTLLNVSGLVDLDEAAGIGEVERYTYIYEMNCQEIDHLFVSKSIAGKSPKLEHVHVNTWVSLDDQVSDHDPSVALLNVCAAT